MIDIDNTVENACARASKTLQDRVDEFEKDFRAKDFIPTYARLLAVEKAFPYALKEALTCTLKELEKSK